MVDTTPLIAFQSHPSRGAWIEIERPAERWPVTFVAPLTGCVD